MWTTMTTLILLCVLSCLHAQNSGSAPSRQVQLQSNGMDYALFGYDSLKGCPLTQGYHTGFTFPIFSAQSHVTGDNGGPRGVVLSPEVSCVTSFTSTVVETPYELTKLMAVTAHLDADKWGPPFSASQDFQKFSAELKQNVLVFSTAVCGIYHVKLLLSEPPSFHSSFVEWIIKLNNTDDEDMYLKFLDTYGTHFVSRARFGASITVVHKMEDEVYRRFTEGHVTSVASYVAAALFGQPQTSTSDQQKAANEFQNEVETTTIAVGVSLPYAGNSLTWVTAAKGQPSAIDYDLTSVEVLFSDTLMGNSSLIGSYGIDHVRIMNNIVAVKTKYCWTLKRQDLTGECEGSEGKTLLSTKLMGKSEHRAAKSADQCVEGCYQLLNCVAVSFCRECRQTNLSNNCQVFSAGDIQTAVSDPMWHTTILVHKLETFVKLQNTTVVVNSSSQSNISIVTSAQDCFPSCIEDATCLVFALMDTSGSLLTCTRHTDSLQSLTQRTGVTVYFLSPLVKKIVRSGQTKGLAPSSMYNDWTKAACVIDDECRQENSICFMNRCRCRPGFFSTLDNTCSANCSQADLHTTFMDYPDSGIRGHNIVERVGVSLQTCSSLCVRNRVCVSFDFRVTGGRCLLHEVTSLQAQSQWYPQTSRGWTHYQRTCLQFPTLYPGPQWYNSPCNINTVCPEPNSQCVAGRCLCRSPFILSGTDGTCRVPESCRDWQTTGIRSGVYSIQLPQNSSQKRVWCDMDSGDGGWLVFQRRKDGSVDFYRNWTQYENGFGDITGEFWLGLSHLYLLTRGRQQRLRIEVGRKIGGRRYAEYSSFRVEGPETNYRLNLSGYSGNAADSFMPLNGGMFSTYDRDNSKNVQNCAVEYRAAWWYKPPGCFVNACNLNGQYNWTSYGIVWYYYYWSYDSLHFSEMKLRPA